MNEQEREQRPPIDVLELEGTADLPDFHTRQSLAKVTFTDLALADARKHARSDDREICGVCFGCVRSNAEAELEVLVEECWPAPHAQSSMSTVTFTYKSWADALDRLDELRERQPEYGWRIVGWYHSHPNFGIFLSGTDRHTHQTYFSRPWHIALVVDPKRSVEGVFYRTGNRQNLEQCTFQIVPASRIHN